MAANALRAVSGHQANDEAANDRHRDDEISQMVADRRHHFGRESLVEKHIRKETDQLQQPKSDKCADGADSER